MEIKKYEELPERIEFKAGGLRIGKDQILYYDFHSKTYYVVPYYPHVANIDLDDKVMIPYNNSELKIGEWGFGVSNYTGIFPVDYQLYLKIDGFNIITYNFKKNISFVGHILVEPFLNVPIINKIITRIEAKNLRYK